MDPAIAAAARALSTGDPLAALRRVALRDDAAALALRGIAMAQLGDLAKARELLRRAARGFGPREPLERARCRAAEAEVALASRDLAWRPRALAQALRTFTAHGDRENAAHVRLLQLRRLVLLGRIDEAAAACAALELAGWPPGLACVAALVAFEVAARRGNVDLARAALARAREAAARSGIGALRAEVEQAGRALALPAARLVVGGGVLRPLTLAQVAGVRASAGVIVDACRRTVRLGDRVVPLARRPVLFALLFGLCEAWPGAASREALVARAFAVRRMNASHRVRLRVEVGRLRQALRGIADPHAAPGGFQLVVSEAPVQLLAPPIDSPEAPVLALLADGEAWSTSALALAVGASQRTVQRALRALEEAAQVRAMGSGRSRRWLAAPLTGFATSLLLPLSGRTADAAL